MKQLLFRLTPAQERLIRSEIKRLRLEGFPFATAAKVVFLNALNRKVKR